MIFRLRKDEHAVFCTLHLNASNGFYEYEIITNYFHAYFWNEKEFPYEKLPQSFKLKMLMPDFVDRQILPH